MRLNLYRMMQTDKKELVLIKEKGFNYKTEEDTLNNPNKIANMMNTLFKLDMQAEEYVYMLTLDRKAHPRGIFEISHGNMNNAILEPREFYRKALLCNATGVVCIHNHPSGDPSPSKEDIKTTSRLCKAGCIIGMDLIDHIIIGKGSIFSFRDERMLAELK